MRNIPALVVVIIGVVAIIAVVAFVIASIAQNYSEAEKEAETQTAVTQLPELNQNMYILQLFASQNYSRLEHQKQKLEKEGYNTIVTKTMKNGEILYRLRLEGLYGKAEALALGDEIKRKFPSIQNFWLDQIGTEESVSEHISQQEVIDEKGEEGEQNQEQVQKPAENIPEKLPEEIVGTPVTKSSGKQYEVQLMASSNYAKIEEAKSTLAKLGYNTKILNLNEGKKIVYRLRLKDLYSQESGVALGEKIIKESNLISGYWLDEIENGKSVPANKQLTKSTQPPAPQTKTYAGEKIYEIQLLANTKRDLVESRKQDLEKKGYQAKILSVVVNGTTYYRLRLADSYSQEEAQDIGNQLKKKVSFVKDYWVVKKSADDHVITSTSKTTKQETPKPKEEKKPVPAVNQQAKETENTPSSSAEAKIVDYSATCNANDVNIRTGPGAEFEVDPIGKLMQGITVFVVEEKGEWARFTITPNDESWSGWVRLVYLDKN
ncbi:MAG TPA: SPOR domain-containing protein [Candidatus Cloacimonadota bacterium]|nr:SPOR domain-containing protein [Candidatus Cloacimonadota bacterium]